MLISLYFSKLHILVLVYVVVEFAKRMMKEQYYATKTKENKELTENNVRNVEMFISHTLIFIAYFLEKKNRNISEEKTKEEENSEYRIMLLKNTENFQKLQHQKIVEKFEKVWILIIIISLLNIISYFPIDTIYTKIYVNGNNSIGFYILILLICEKIMLKTEYSSHHYLSTITLLLTSIANLINTKWKNDDKYKGKKGKEDKLYNFDTLCIHLIIYSLYHYLPQTLFFNLFYYINENYYTSLYFISGFEGVFCTIITLIFEFYIYYPEGKSIIHVMQNTYNNYNSDLFWNFLVFICMAIQNFLSVLTLTYFKPSINGIITTTYPILDLFKNYFREAKDKNDFTLFDYFNFVIIILTVLIYCELIVLNFWGLNKGVRVKIIERGVREKIADELNILDNSFNINNSSLNSTLNAIN